MSVKKITRHDLHSMWYGERTLDVIWSHIDSLQTELTRLESMVQGREGMTVEDIKKVLYDDDCATYIYDERYVERLAKLIQPLTVPQGFVPDWSKAIQGTKGVAIVWSVLPESEWTGNDTFVQFIHRPTPVKKMRIRTRESMIHELVRYYNKTYGLDKLLSMDKIIEELDSGKSLKDLCTAAGISLEEEV